jgi:hypothetical protein
MTYCEKTAEEIRESMNSRYDTNTAYSLQLLWDIARMEDLNQKTMAMIQGGSWKYAAVRAALRHTWIHWLTIRASTLAMWLSR